MKNKESKKEIQLNEVAQSIWNEISELDVEWYGLPNIKVNNICEPLSISQTSLFVSLKGPAAISSLETALNKTKKLSLTGKPIPKYVIELVDKYGEIKENPAK